eukprot:scaffold12766_cov117-Isochrysis_galbana.AAC.5
MLGPSVGSDRWTSVTHRRASSCAPVPPRLRSAADWRMAAARTSREDTTGENGSGSQAVYVGRGSLIGKEDVLMAIAVGAARASSGGQQPGWCNHGMEGDGRKKNLCAEGTA